MNPKSHSLMTCILIGIALLIFMFNEIILTASQQVPKSNETDKSETQSDRPFFGAFIRDVGDDQSRELEVTAQSGAVVTRTTPQSPAALAGLQPGDVITEFDNRPIQSIRDSHQLFQNCKTDQEINLLILRGAETFKITAKLRA